MVGGLFMKIFNSLKFSFGDGMLWLDGPFEMLTIDENNLATLTITSIQNDDKTEQSYSCQLSPEKTTQFENFAYNHNKRNLYPFCTDISFPIIKKLQNVARFIMANFCHQI